MALPHLHRTNVVAQTAEPRHNLEHLDWKLAYYAVTFGLAECYRPAVGRSHTVEHRIEVAVDDVAVPGVLVYRFDAPLIYSNTEAFAAGARRYIGAQEKPLERVVIDCEAISDVDATGAESLVTLVSTLRDTGVEVRIVRMHRTVREALDRGGATDQIGPDSFLRNPEDALPGDD